MGEGVFLPPQNSSSRTPRAVSQEATREKLIASAEHLIVSGSIPGLSLRQLCAEAGLTQGAFYANFISRDALLLEVMERHLTELRRQLAALILSLEATGREDVFGALASWLNGLHERREWALLAIELRLQANRHIGFGEALRCAEARIMSGLAALLNDVADALGCRLALPALTLAETLLGLWYALVLRRPENDCTETVFLTVLRRMFLISHSSGDGAD